MKYHFEHGFEDRERRKGKRMGSEAEVSFICVQSKRKETIRKKEKVKRREEKIKFLLFELH